MCLSLTSRKYRKHEVAYYVFDSTFHLVRFYKSKMLRITSKDYCNYYSTYTCTVVQVLKYDSIFVTYHK